MLHQTLHVCVQYEIESSYLATVMESMFITLPTVLDVKLCLMMNGHLCMFKQTLYLVECMNWCIYALFINDEKQIEKNCFLKTINLTTNSSLQLGWIPMGHQCLSSCEASNYMCNGNLCYYD